ncbi:hypothetical protein J0H58_13615 [bacterium]|nr:hypothetical protein [bacterium]
MTLSPHVYHLAEAANWPSIRARGLLPASVLFDLAGLVGAARDRVERAQRADHTELPNGLFVRDQKPMPPAALAGCLVGLTAADWYALVNARVFFWLDPDRLNRQRAACGPRPQVVLTLDTAALVDAYLDVTAVTPINTGNARRKPALRGAATFVPYPTWLDSGWATEAVALGTRERKRTHPPAELTIAAVALGTRERKRTHPPAELTIAAAVPDALRFVAAVTELPPGEAFTPGRDPVS